MLSIILSELGLLVKVHIENSQSMDLFDQRVL